MALPRDLQDALNRLRPKDEGPASAEPTPVLVDGEPVRSLTDREHPEAHDPDTPEPETDPVRSDQTLADVQARLAEERAQRAAAEREVQFLRSARETPPPPPPVDPTPAILDALRVPEDTWAEMIADPKVGANRLTEMAHRMFLLGNQTAKAQTMAEMQAVLDARDNQIRVQNQTENLQTEFWRRNPDLEPYAEAVIGVTSQVAAEQATTPRSADELIQEVATRTRATLKKYGIETGGQTQKVAARRIRPASADMGGTGGRPTQNLSPQQKQMFRLAGLKG